MLKSLLIKNLAVIDELKVEFGSGFQVLTGDTGAGKSVLIEAIGLILGERADNTMIRDGKDQAVVEGVFQLPAPNAITQILTDEVLLNEENPHELVIRRSFSKSEPSKVWINGLRTTAGILRRLARELVDFTGQHAAQDLRDSAQDIEILDSFLGDDNDFATYRVTYHKCHEIYRSWQELQKKLLTKAERLDWIDFQLRELSELPVASESEAEELQVRREKMQHARSLARLVALMSEELVDGEQAIAGRLKHIISEFQKNGYAANFFEGVAAQIDEARIKLEEAAFAATRMLPELDDDESLSREAIDEKMHILAKLRRKYGPGIEDILLKKAELANEKNEWNGSEDKLEKLSALLASELQVLKTQADKLSKKRHAIKEKIEDAVKKELAYVGMEKARFIVSIDRIKKPGSSDVAEDFSELACFNERGLDSVTFLMSPNPGLEPKPVSKSSSGGELSRLFLALKRVLAQNRQSVSFIFDEIDTGISGVIVKKVGERLRDLSRQFQVFCITHHAQIAGLADSHYLVEKSLTKNHTITRIRTLNREERIDEMARLMSGDTITSKNRAFAKELLEKQ